VVRLRTVLGYAAGKTPSNLDQTSRTARIDCLLMMPPAISIELSYFREPSPEKGSAALTGIPHEARSPRRL